MCASLTDESKRCQRWNMVFSSRGQQSVLPLTIITSLSIDVSFAFFLAKSSLIITLLKIENFDYKVHPRQIN